MGSGAASDGGATVTFLDLFSGIGAMRLGFERACRDSGRTPSCVGFSEIDEAATGVYSRHFPATPSLGEVRALASSQAIPECDVVLAGFPCPSYSMAGARRGLADERGRLFFALARIIGRARPKAFLLENVAGLASHRRGRTLAGMLDLLRRRLGYCVHHAVFNSSSFGVPQNRPRIYLVGLRDGVANFAFPAQPNHDGRLKDVLADESVDPRYYLSERYLAWARRHKARHAARGNGFGYRILNPAIDVASALVCGGMGQDRNLVVDDRVRPSPNREHVRRLTPLEWERLQGLPDGVTEGQADSARYRQLGNAVTVPVVRAVAKSVLDGLARGNAPEPIRVLPVAPRNAQPVRLPLTAVDVFAGCGGLSRGLAATGDIAVEVACELEPTAAATYRLNHPRTVMVEGDITIDATIESIAKALDGRTCDLLAGGVPCQPFSLSGRRLPDDPRGRLFERYMRLVQLLAPRVAVIENVVGILSAKAPGEMPVLAAIASAFRGLGYAVGHHVVNAADYGDPQSRTRVVIFAWREGAIPRFAKTHDRLGRDGLPRWRTVRDAISDLEDAPEDQIHSHVFTNCGPEFVSKMRRTPVGGSVLSAFGEAYFRNPPDQPAVTVKGNHGGVLVHYARNRLMTPRELARLQGFPDSYRFAGSKSAVLEQIGNAVPVGLATGIGRAVLAMLLPRDNSSPR